jgi:acyl-CoA synthetase (AMP-forming)/AMP-acid ligase II
MFDLTFDFSVATLFTPLVKGASVFTIPQKSIRYNHILRLLLTENLTVLPMVPSLLNHLSQYYGELPLADVKYCYFCGEALPVNPLQVLAEYATNARFVNFYGPTEATVFSTAYEWDPGSGSNKSYNGVVSIGRPMPGFKCRIEGASKEEVQTQGEKGELLLCGPQVTPGYWSDPQLNNQTFVSEKTDDKELIWYRTGDLAFRDSEGDYFFAGRIDQQVQIQGFRVELEEIEYFAKEFTGRNEAYAVAYESDIDNLKIHLFLQGENEDFSELRAYLKSKLPHYMVPSGISVLVEIPLNQNGKVDRLKLARIAGGD